MGCIFGTLGAVSLTGDAMTNAHLAWDQVEREKREETAANAKRKADKLHNEAEILRLSGKDVDQLNVNELKTLLKDCDLPHKGYKAELVARYNQHLHGSGPSTPKRQKNDNT